MKTILHFILFPFGAGPLHMLSIYPTTEPHSLPPQ
jgi:hypothetical protein